MTSKAALFEGKKKYDFLTFDCYGTLIDWETGIRTAFEGLFDKTEINAAKRTELFNLYEQEERVIELEQPFHRYQDVMKLSIRQAARKLGKEIKPALSELFAKQLSRWTPFPDTNPALERLARKHKIGILSNVDDDLLQQTMKHFSVPFNLTITAEHIQSYKPNPKHFEEARKVIGSDKRWLHVAASFYHDIRPATSLGIHSVWLNRSHSVIDKGEVLNLVKQVETLVELADWLESSEPI